MSLLRLLTSGKSLMGLKSTETRYHLPGGKPLPRFGSKKNPFRATVFPEKADPSAEAAPVQANSGEGLAGEKTEGEVKASVAESSANNGIREISGSSNDQGRLKEAESGQKPPPRRTSAFKALILWGRAKRTKFSSMPAGGPMVQGELSLDTVKVVRNDLSESDLEVVQAKSPPSSNNSEISADAPKQVASAMGWGAVAGGLLSIGKM